MKVICPRSDCRLHRQDGRPCSWADCPFRQHAPERNNFEDTERIQMDEYIKRKYPQLGEDT